MAGSGSLVSRGVSRLLGLGAASHRLRVQRPIVVLTYDDGPDPVHTPAVLAALAEHGATATFFVLMTRARATPSLLAEVLSEGHELALHGPDHRPVTAFSRAEAFSRTLDAAAALEDLAQTRIRRFRPPYGVLTPSVVRATRAARMRTLLWSRATLDWIDATTEQRLHAATDGARSGDVLLAHDARANAADGAEDGAAPDVDRGELTRLVLERLESMGLQGGSAEHSTSHP